MVNQHPIPELFDEPVDGAGIPPLKQFTPQVQPLVEQPIPEEPVAPEVDPLLETENAGRNYAAALFNGLPSTVARNKALVALNVIRDTQYDPAVLAILAEDLTSLNTAATGAAVGELLTALSLVKSAMHAFVFEDLQALIPECSEKNLPSERISAIFFAKLLERAGL